MAEGWVSVHRTIQDHWLWEDKPFSKGQAWIDLLMLANHEDSKFLLGNQLVEAKRGDVITSEIKLMARWGWSNTKVRTFISLLEKDSMLIKKTDSKKSVLTLTNYSVWQDSKSEKKVQQKCIRSALEVQKNTINNSNNSNNSNNVNNSNKSNISSCLKNKFSDNAIEISLSSELFNLMLVNNQNAKKPDFQKWAKSIDLMIRADKRDPVEIGEVIRWCQRDSFWKGNILSTSKLRDKYDQLVLRMKSPKQTKSETPNFGKERNPKESSKYDKFYL